jgi:hypothetical protein
VDPDRTGQPGCGQEAGDRPQPGLVEELLHGDLTRQLQPVVAHQPGAEHAQPDSPGLDQMAGKQGVDLAFGDDDGLRQPGASSDLEELLLRP